MLSPVVIFPLYASKADRSSKETPLSYMLNRFDPGLASSNLCLCFKNQIRADKEALLKINLTQSLVCPENLCQGSCGGGVVFGLLQMRGGTVSSQGGTEAGGGNRCTGLFNEGDLFYVSALRSKSWERGGVAVRLVPKTAERKTL